MLGLSAKGRLAVGFDADLALLDEELRVLATFRDGELLYGRGTRQGQPAFKPARTP
jgi:N-acetylglucosamine-6-phosphate deacetylase